MVELTVRKTCKGCGKLFNSPYFDDNNLCRNCKYDNFPRPGIEMIT